MYTCILNCCSTFTDKPQTKYKHREYNVFICPQAETNTKWLKIGYFGIFRVKGVIFTGIELVTLSVRIILEL